MPWMRWDKGWHTYYPDKTKVALYQKRYAKYHHLGGFIEGSIKLKEKEAALSN